MLQDLAVRSDQSLELREATRAASDFARASKAGATIKAYQADAADFAAWCKRHNVDAVTRKAPATAETIRAIVDDMPTDLRGLRDRALLLLGFAGALRRSELVALDVADLARAAASRCCSCVNPCGWLGVILPRRASGRPRTI